MSYRVLEPEIVDNVPAVAEDSSGSGLSTGAKVALGIGLGLVGVLLLLGAAFGHECSECRRGTELEDLRSEEEERKRKAQEEAARLRYRFEKLRHKYERRPHLERREFIEQFAAVHRSELLRQRHQILEAYSELQQDAPLVELLNREAPEIYRRAIWRIEALALAEQLDVGLQLEGKDTKRESPEQFRERKTRREATLIEDKIATARERIEARLKVRAMLDEYPLDADERQQIEMEVLTDISNGTNGQDSVTSLVK
jgi:hypothetical protein